MSKTFHEFDIDDDRDEIIRIENDPDYKIYARIGFKFIDTVKDEAKNKIVEKTFLRLLIFWDGPEYSRGGIVGITPE